MSSTNETNKAMRQAGFLPIMDVARAWGCSHTTVARWIDDGRVEGEEVGGGLHRRFVKIDSLRKFMGVVNFSRFMSKVEALERKALESKDTNAVA